MKQADLQYLLSQKYSGAIRVRRDKALSIEDAPVQHLVTYLETCSRPRDLIEWQVDSFVQTLLVKQLREVQYLGATGFHSNPYLDQAFLGLKSLEDMVPGKDKWFFLFQSYTGPKKIETDICGRKVRIVQLLDVYLSINSWLLGFSDDDQPVLTYNFGDPVLENGKWVIKYAFHLQMNPNCIHPLLGNFPLFGGYPETPPKHKRHGR